MTVMETLACRPARRVAARLTFERRGARTVLMGQRTPHPFHITRPFHLADDPWGMATLYLQSSAGGLYGDDDLSLDVAVEAGAAAHVTTQASTVALHARGGRARHAARLTVGEGGFLEYVPEPLILFAGARVDAEVRATVAPGARLILADAALAHDPDGAGAPFDRYRNEIAVETSGGRPLLIDRMEADGAAWAARCGARPCLGGLLVAGAENATAAAAALEAALTGPADGPVYAGVSAWPEKGVAYARMLCADGAALSAALRAAWAAAREALTGSTPPPRRK